MNRISSPLSQIQAHYDIVVIGSGYGGGIAASRLSRARKKVCLLERGKEFMPGEFPGNLLQAGDELQVDTAEKKIGSKLGLFNFHIGKDVNVLVGCGLGGTSLINANVALRLDPRVWQNGKWPKEIIADLEKGVEAGYKRAEEMLKPNPYPENFPTLDKLEAHKKSAEAIKQPFYRPPINVTFEDKVNHVGVSQKKCTNCGDCVGGCNYTSKNTTQMNYLPDAWNHGAEIFTQCHVNYLSKVDGKWQVSFQSVGMGREKFDAPQMFVTADIVVVSAGTLGSTEIMLRSAKNGLKVSEMLGKRFSGNGDVLAFGWNAPSPIHGIGYGNEPVNPEKQVGPCITSIIDTRETVTHYQDGMSIEEGSIPGAMRGILTPAFSALAAAESQNKPQGFFKKMSAFSKRLFRIGESTVGGAHVGAIDHTQTYLIMTHDSGSGTMALSDKNKLSLAWPGYGEEPIFQKANETLKQCAFALDATFLKNPIWNKEFGHDLISVHPLGGCIMGEDITKGVVNHKGQVFNPEGGVHQGLYITDGSVIPTSLGTNPLFTISAISERNMALLAQERGWQISYQLPSSHAPVPPTKPGIRFTETMKGYYSKAETTANYQNGYDQGKADGTSLEFTLTIESDDVAELIGSPEHLAYMTGTVTAKGLAETEDFQVVEGQFNLFVDYAPEVGTKRMNYAMQMDSPNGQKYYFKGYKEVNDDKGPRIWHDTSTLYITLFNGPDEHAPVLGQGILQIELADFMKQMTTMKVVNAAKLTERIETMTKFGKYFAGSLWETYCSPEKQKEFLHNQAANV